ncbi:hypothetical protein, partial [Nocardia gipuzkoensis]|uniref:hypothetical protein n=1 Tax=Nocardia gipuzkoensis TaxID=2749991 RepID=UPI002457ABE1
MGGDVAALSRPRAPPPGQGGEEGAAVRARQRPEPCRFLESHVTAGQGARQPQHVGHRVHQKRTT